MGDSLYGGLARLSTFWMASESLLMRVGPYWESQRLVLVATQSSASWTFTFQAAETSRLQVQYW